MEFNKYIRCPKCDSERWHKYGFARGNQRYKCGLCNGQFTFSKRRETFEEHRFMALQLFLEGLSYRQIAREISISRRRINEKTIRKWIALTETTTHLTLEQIMKIKTPLFYVSLLILKMEKEMPGMSVTIKMKRLLQDDCNAALDELNKIKLTIHEKQTMINSYL